MKKALCIILILAIALTSLAAAEFFCNAGAYAKLEKISYAGVKNIMAGGGPAVSAGVVFNNKIPLYGSVSYTFEGNIASSSLFSRVSSARILNIAAGSGYIFNSFTLYGQAGLKFMNFAAQRTNVYSMFELSVIPSYMFELPHNIKLEVGLPLAVGFSSNGHTLSAGLGANIKFGGTK